MGDTGRGGTPGRRVQLGPAILVPERPGAVRLVDGPHGVQRLVPLDDVIQRAAQSPRIQRRIAGAIGLEAEVALLRQQVEALEIRLRRLEDGR